MRAPRRLIIAAGLLFLAEGTFTALVDVGRVRAELTFAR